jgi:hypothetical protein
MVQFFIVFKGYFVEILPWLAVGFFLSGLIHEFTPSRWIERHLGRSGIKPLFYATLFGTVLPICCVGSLPVAITLHKKGAALGTVLAFLVATPATSISALLVCYALLGIKFTVFIFFAVIVMGLSIGLIGNSIKIKPKAFQNEKIAIDPVCGMNVEIAKAAKTEYGGEVYYFCCPHCQRIFENSPEGYVGVYSLNIAHRMKHILKFAFVDMVKEIGPELLWGLALAALVATIAPMGKFIGSYFGGGFGYLFSLGFGLVMYICSTASVPLVHAFISQGMNIGAGMVLLLVGPVTSLGTIMVLRKEFGVKTLGIYLATISIMALFLGYCSSII